MKLEKGTPLFPQTSLFADTKLDGKAISVLT